MDEKTGTLSLYRRWRPQRFSEVVGQRLVTETLRRAVAQGKLAHAYLFAGQRGVGKTSVARILARAANCLQPEDGEPCNKCPNCLRIMSGRSLDVVEIDGASNRGIDQIRRLREEVGYLPADARYKVYIIDEVHMLTGEAFNALLKTLEEPPSHVIFIFATTEPHKVPTTVLSRCQVFEFSPIPDELIRDKLLEIAAAEGIKLPQEAAELIARRAQGSLRDAEVLLEQLAQGGEITPEAVVDLLGLPPLGELDRFLDAVSSGDAAAALELVDRTAARGRDLGLFLEEAAARARDRIIAGEPGLIPIAKWLLGLRAELPRAVSRKLHLELEILARCGYRARPKEPPEKEEPSQGRPKERPNRGEAQREPGGPPQAGPQGPDRPLAPPTEPSEGFAASWRKLLREILPERPSIAAFLSPARPELTDGLLVVSLPADARFHYESLLEPENKAYVERMAQRFFPELLTVDIRWEGTEDEGPSLEERARILADALEGEILKEENT